MSNGFKGKIQEIVLGLQAQRKNEKRAVSMREYIANQFPGMTVEHLYADHGFEHNRTRLEELWNDADTRFLAVEIINSGISLGLGVPQREQLANLRAALIGAASQSAFTFDATRWITPEQFTDPIRRGAVQAAFYNDLIIDDVPATSDSVTMPQIDLSDAEPQDITELATIPVGYAIYGDKKVGLNKRGCGLKISYEAMRRHTLNFVQIYFIDLGLRLASLLNKDLVNVGVNGDQASGSESCAVIGVTDTGVGLQYKDVTRAFVRMSRMGRVPLALVGSEEMVNKWLNLPEVKNRQQGSPIIGTRLKTPIPADLDVYVSATMSSTQIMLVDASLSFVKLTELPLMTETDKIISKQLEETYASTVTGFGNVQRDGRIIIDESVTIVASPFPSWFDAK
jgi:hypothetical protein